MAIELHIGNATGEISNLIPLIKVSFSTAKKESLKLFDDIDVDIFVVNDTYGVIPEYGFGGYTPSSNTVYLYVDKKIKTLDVNLLISLMLHELSHAARWAKVGYGDTLGGAMVSEGIACYIEEKYLGFIPIYANFDIEQGIVNTAKKDLNSKNYNHNDWFYGSELIPRWAGYAMGYQMVKKYCDNIKTDKNIVEIDADTITSFYFNK
jgi:uncharacterized protein YjaZ